MGGRFRSLDQTHSEREWNLAKILLQVQLLFPNSIEDQKKVFSKNWRGFVPEFDWR